MTTQDTRIAAWRLLACALGDDDVKADHLRLIMNQLDRNSSLVDALVTLADIAATLYRDRHGVNAHDAALSAIAHLLDEAPRVTRRATYKTPRKDEYD